MKYFTSHANERYYDRSTQIVTKKTLSKHIHNGGLIHFAKRESSTKSLAYIPIDESIFKVIINRKTKQIISILEFNDIFKRNIRVHSEYYGNAFYIISLYPDCYRSTQSNHALTEIFKIDKDDNNEVTLSKINFNHPFFEGLFNAAWKIHLAIKGLEKHDNEKQAKTLEIVLENGKPSKAIQEFIKNSESIEV